MDFYSEIYDSPVGLIEIIATNIGICNINQYQAIAKERSNHITSEAKTQLTAYFDKKLKNFDLPIDFLEASPFYRKVWKELLNIPYGETTNYQQIAVNLDNPKSVRAVGMANAKNKIPIIIPCHRVIGRDGSLTGFAWGLHVKSQLLSLENPNFGIQTELF
jgi:methylated-DNA-[protein]-cysteine S-methyltransferase